VNGSSGHLHTGMALIIKLTETKTDNILYVFKFAMANLKYYQKKP